MTKPEILEEIKLWLTGYNVPEHVQDALANSLILKQQEKTGRNN